MLNKLQNNNNNKHKLKKLNKKLNKKLSKKQNLNHKYKLKSQKILFLMILMKKLINQNLYFNKLNLKSLLQLYKK